MKDAIEIEARIEPWELLREFKISRSSRKHSDVIVVELRHQAVLARGECAPTRHYGETPESVLAQIASLSGNLKLPQARAELQQFLPAGAARNGIDCALWDLESKLKQQSVAELIGIDNSRPITTVQTIGLCPVEEAKEQAQQFQAYPAIKIKIEAATPLAYIEAIHHAAPQAKLLIDANEALDLSGLKQFIDATQHLPIWAIEQPLKADADDGLSGFASPIPIIADESCHSAADISGLVDKYQVVNIKLDKCGGLTEGLKILASAKEAGLQIMVGCMLGTSLAIAPAALLAQDAAYVDLDSPVLLKTDRQGGIPYHNGVLQPSESQLWGCGKES